MFDVCVIGHITKDIVRTKTLEKTMPGGVAYYSSIALKSLGSNISLITKCAEKDKDLLNDLIKDNISIFYQGSQQTTVFENIYLENRDFRCQNVHCIAQPFTLKDIPNISAKIYHLGPLTKEDIPLEIIKYISKKGKISLDIQGFLRKIENSEVKSIDWEEKDEGLTYVNILKADEMEAKILSEEDNIKKAAVKLSAYGIDEIIITLGSKGALIYYQKKFYSIPSFAPKKIVDATGCGDTYIAGYIYKRLQSHDIKESGRFAAAMTSLKLEKFGAFQGSEEEVKNFLELEKMRSLS